LGIGCIVGARAKGSHTTSSGKTNYVSIMVLESCVEADMAVMDVLDEPADGGCKEGREEKSH
jgi:hypothetical protein